MTELPLGRNWVPFQDTPIELPLYLTCKINGLKKTGNGDSPKLKRTHHFFIIIEREGLAMV